MDHYARQKEAAAKVEAMLALPLPEDRYSIGDENEFHPWAIFPAIYGSYSGEFDKMALEVLCDLRDMTHKRDDLASEILKEMLCVSNLCDYGTSPRVCFPTQEFRALLPALIAKWLEFTAIKWEGWDPEVPHATPK